MAPDSWPLAGLVVKTSASGVEDPGFESRLQLDFPGSSHTSDLKIGTPVATLPGAWHYGVSAGTGWPGVSILWLGEVESLICNFYLSVAAHKIVCADPSLRYTSMLLGRKAANQQTADSKLRDKISTWSLMSKATRTVRVKSCNTRNRINVIIYNTRTWQTNDDTSRLVEELGYIKRHVVGLCETNRRGEGLRELSWMFN